MNKIQGVEENYQEQIMMIIYKIIDYLIVIIIIIIIMTRFFCSCTKYFMSENNLNKHKNICLLSCHEQKPIHNVKDCKQKIIQLFMDNVKGKQIDLSNTNKSHKSHDGKEGHWLETQMNITHTSSRYIWI